MILSSEKFVPHPLEHLTQVRAFPSPLPEDFYKKICAEYEQVSDVITNRIVYASDGLKITGISCLPAKSEIGKHPIYIYNRGGNKEYGMLSVLAVMRSMLPFARQGYLAYASNYRGNDGGEGMDEFGGRDVSDVLNLIETAKQNPAWDGKNIFMTGHSRGGMMAYMCVRANKQINAAISIAGLSDMVKPDERRPEMEERVYKKLIHGEGSQREEAYYNRSALRWADEITTPLLLFHGTADDALDVNYSLDMAEKLKELGKVHELIIYEGGNHVLLRFWSDLLEKSINWFERFRI